MSDSTSVVSDKKMKQRTIVQPLLTDMYQITMAYVYWKSGKLNDRAVFELFFRKNPFSGEFTIFAGLHDCLKFLEGFRYSESDIEYLKTILPSETEYEFFDYLLNLTVENLEVYAIDEGTVVFPRVPLLRLEGPLILVNLLETTLLTLVNYASLMTTNAARYRMAAGNNVRLFEFGLRRAQGPDGGLSASKYAYMGGCDATSNLLAGKLFGIPVCGTHAHSFVTSFTRGFNELKIRTLEHKVTNEKVDLLQLSLDWRDRISALQQTSLDTHDGELAAFVSYAVSFPNGFVALVDTYDVLKSGIPNFCAVAMALNDLQYQAIGIRIDSGDLAYLAQCAYIAFERIAEKFNIPWFKDLLIIVSNDINEETILSLNDQGNHIKGYGIGTHLVTCQKQPALGCVYKMVEVNGQPRLKISQEMDKMTLPGKKDTFRLYGTQGYCLADLMQVSDEATPVAGKKVLCRHTFDRTKRCYIVPQSIEKLHNLYWKNGEVCRPLPTLSEIKEHVQDSLATIRPDIKRNLNPTPYKISVSEKMFDFIQNLWMVNAPIGELT